MTRFVNRVYQGTATPGQTTSIILRTTPFSNAFLTMAEAGAIDGQLYTYCIEEGDDFEVQEDQVYTAATRTLARGTPSISKIGGVVGTTKMSLTGNAMVRVTPSAKSLQDAADTAVAMAIALG